MKVEFVTSGGERVSANAEPGDNLLRVAQAAGKGWAAVDSAPQPSDDALLALARDMCH